MIIKINSNKKNMSTYLAKELLEYCHKHCVCFNQCLSVTKIPQQVQKPTQ
jgi:hypothetical protein